MLRSNTNQAEKEMTMYEKMIEGLKARKDRSAWDKGVTLYAEEMVESLGERAKYEGRNPEDWKEAREWLLNGAADWYEYSWGGSSLIYDGDIARRLCTSSELKKTRGETDSRTSARSRATASTASREPYPGRLDYKPSIELLRLNTIQTEAEAKKRCKKSMQNMRNCSNVLKTSTRGPTEEHTVQKMFDMIKNMNIYIDNVKSSGCSPNTAENYKRAITLFYRFQNNRNRETVAVNDIVDYKIRLYEAGLKQSTIRTYLKALSLFFNFCVETGALEKTPCKTAVAKIKVEPPKNYEHILTKNEIVKALTPSRPAGATKKTWEKTYAIIAVLLTSGIRNTELRELTVSDLDFQNGTLHIKRGKGGKERICAFPEIAQKAVAGYLKSNCFPNDLTAADFLFGKGTTRENWKPYERSELSTLVRRYVKCATGKDNVRTHALRHSSASVLWDSGMTTDEISELLGHSNVAVTQRYLDRLRPEQPTKHACEKFGSILGA